MNQMPPIIQRRATGPLATVLALAASLLIAPTPVQADMYRLTPTPGGIDSRPQITSVTPSGSNVVVHWHGLQAPQQLEMTPSLSPPQWSQAATPTLAAPGDGTVTLTNLQGDQNFFRMVMTNNPYRGAGDCYNCHSDKYNEWINTGHASAMSLLDGLPPSVAQSCIVCHNVGYGQPNGFVDVATTPQLANVGCEACHGPAGAHKAISNKQYHPVNTLASELCGGCHDGVHHPTYTEWSQTPHATVVPDVSSGFADTPSGQSRMMSCGPCHSGAVRDAMDENNQALLAGYITATNALVLPTANDASAFAVTCVVCHDPHSTNGGPFQLRHPIYSTNFYTFTTGSATNALGQYINTVFSTQYVAGVQMCGQCHNSRGAKWTDSSRAPHHSPQYNILTGIIQAGYLNSNNIIAPHGLQNTNQCVQCHMHQETPETVTEENPAYTGHGFEVSLDGCVTAGCHSSTDVASELIYGIQYSTTTNMSAIVGLLNTWATNKSPAVLRTNYGQYSWEFSTPGEFSNPLSSTNIIGPSSSRQASIPDTIKQARFNVYMVLHDNSLGVHNGPYTRFLLNYASSNVLYELSR
jgi:hypothetical protein